MGDSWKDYSTIQGFTGAPNSLWYDQDGYWGGRMAAVGLGVVAMVVIAPFYAAYEIYTHFPNETILGSVAGVLTTGAVLPKRVTWPKAAKIAVPIAAALAVAGGTYLARPILPERAIPNMFRSQDDIASDGGKISEVSFTSENTRLAIAAKPIKFFPLALGADTTLGSDTIDWPPVNLANGGSSSYHNSYQIDAGAQILIGPCAGNVCQAVVAKDLIADPRNDDYLRNAVTFNLLRREITYGVITRQGLANTKPMASDYPGIKFKMYSGVGGGDARVDIYDPSTPLQVISLVGGGDYVGYPQDARVENGRIQYYTDKVGGTLRWVQFYPYQGCLQVSDTAIKNYFTETTGSAPDHTEAFSSRQKIFECSSDLAAPVADTTDNIQSPLQAFTQTAYSRALGEGVREYDMNKYPNGYKYRITVEIRNQVPLRPEDMPSVSSASASAYQTPQP